MTGVLHLVVPESVDDPLRPSGGNRYDRRLADGLRARGHRVQEHLTSPRGLDATLAGLADADLVVVDGLVGCFAPAAVERHATRLRLVVLAHMSFGEVAADACVDEARTLEAAADVVTVSGWTRDRLLGRYALDPSRVHVVTPGADPAPPASTGPDGRRLLCVGAVTRAKGVDVLLDALALLSDLPWTCRVVGPLDGDSALASTVRRNPRVRLTGPLGGRFLAEEYAAADLVVVPSRAESFGIVVAEALARGIPVVGSDVGGLPEALGGFPDSRAPGRLVPAGEAPALAAALRGWLTDPALRSAWRAAAADRRTAVATWEDTVERFERVLDLVPAGALR